MSSGPVAVIDIGSNTIKALVADRDGTGEISAVKTHAVDARISAGISQSGSALGAEGMALGVGAIKTLLAKIAAFQPAQTAIVATSAVRDASNGAEFCARVRAATGHDVRILTGEEEAAYIGRGLIADPLLHGLRDFYVFDLGGGSLECLAFRGRNIEQAASLRLGCVRLLEKFVSDPERPLSDTEAQRITAHTRDVLAQSAFTFSLPPGSIAVGTGGTVTTVRSIFAAREAKSFEETDVVVTVAQLGQLLEVLAPMPLARRKQISGLPRARADVFPVALATLIAVAEAGGFSAYHHSLYNLRFGIAAELLS